MLLLVPLHGKFKSEYKSLFRILKILQYYLLIRVLGIFASVKTK